MSHARAPAADCRFDDQIVIAKVLMLSGHEYGADREKVTGAEGFRESRRKRAPYQVDRVDHALIVAGSRHRASSLHHAARFRHAAERSENSIVYSELRSDNRHEYDLDTGVCCCSSGVHRSDDLRVAAGEIRQEFIIRDRYLDLQMDRIAVSVIVHVLFHFPCALWELCHPAAGDHLALLDQTLHGTFDNISSVLLAQLANTALAGTQRRDLAPHIALRNHRIADVAFHKIPDRLNQFSPVHELDSREAQPLLESVGRVSRERARRHAADIAPVRFIAGKSNQFIFVENRHDHAHVILVRSSAYERVIDDVHIPRMEIFLADFVYDSADHRRDHSDKAGNSVALRQQAAFRISYAAGVVQRLINDRAHRSLGKSIEYLVADSNERILDDIQCYRIYILVIHYCTSISTMRLPNLSTLRLCPGQTTVAVVGSSTTIGPFASNPHPSLSLS